jgi:hypothetical protein
LILLFHLTLQTNSRKNINLNLHTQTCEVQKSKKQTFFNVFSLKFLNTKFEKRIVSKWQLCLHLNSTINNFDLSYFHFVSYFEFVVYLLACDFQFVSLFIYLSFESTKQSLCCFEYFWRMFLRFWEVNTISSSMFKIIFFQKKWGLKTHTKKILWNWMSLITESSFLNLKALPICYP